MDRLMAKNLRLRFAAAFSLVPASPSMCVWMDVWVSDPVRLCMHACVRGRKAGSAVRCDDMNNT